MANWIAVNHVGTFRKGVVYSSEQLGVLGRMAVYSGHLIPYVEELPSGRPRKTAARKKRKGWADGEVAVQAGSGEDVRDDSGEEGSPFLHSGD